MDFLDIDLTACPIRFICCGGQAWAGWLFLAWMALATIVGIVGIGLGRRRARQTA